MDIRGVYMFSSLMKQNKKAKICFVICFAGKKKLLFYIYAVIVKQKIYKRSSNYYSAQVRMRARSATARCKDQITADISCYCARVQQHHDCGLLLNRTGSMQAAAGCVECTAGTRVPRSGLPRVFVCACEQGITAP